MAGINRHDYDVSRIAVEMQRRSDAPEDQASRRASGLIERFGYLNKLWIVVSFVHMMETMLMFDTATSAIARFITLAATAVMVLGIDLGLMWLSTTIAMQRQVRQPIGVLVWSAFVLALGVEWTFNTGALLGNMPPAAQLSPLLSQLIAVSFGTFVPLIIYVSATAPAQLQRTITALAEQKQWREQQERQQQQQREEQEAERLRQRQQKQRDQELRRRREERELTQLITAPEQAQPVNVDSPATRRELQAPDTATILETATQRDPRGEEWQQLYEEGMTDQQIADQAGKSRQYVNRLRNQYLRSLQPDLEEMSTDEQ